MDLNPKRVVAIIGSGLLVAAAILAVVFVSVNNHGQTSRTAASTRL